MGRIVVRVALMLAGFGAVMTTPVDWTKWNEDQDLAGGSGGKPVEK